MSNTHVLNPQPSILLRPCCPPSLMRRTFFTLLLLPCKRMRRFSVPSEPSPTPVLSNTFATLTRLCNDNNVSRILSSLSIHTAYANWNDHGSEVGTWMIWFSRGMKCVLVCCFIEPGQSKHTALIGGVAGAGVFGLVAVVALAVGQVPKDATVTKQQEWRESRTQQSCFQAGRWRERKTKQCLKRLQC